LPQSGISRLPKNIGTSLARFKARAARSLTDLALRDRNRFSAGPRGGNYRERGREGPRRALRPLVTMKPSRGLQLAGRSKRKKRWFDLDGGPLPLLDALRVTRLPRFSLP